MEHVRLTAILARSPFGGQIYEAGEIRALIATREGLDHARLTSLENAIAAPALLTFAQHLALLARLVDAFAARLPVHAGVFIRGSRFYPIRAPAALLRDDVMFLDAPLAAARAAAVIAPALVINDWFRRMPIEHRDNRFMLDLVGPGAEAGLLSELIEACGLNPFLSGIRCGAVAPPQACAMRRAAAAVRAAEGRAMANFALVVSPGESPC
jgi:hypothetical protein